MPVNHYGELAPALPADGEYVRRVGDTLVGGTPGGGGPHASTHAAGQSDEVTPAAIGAATSGHDHSGVYEPSGAVATHAAAADPHTGYQRESEKGSASGYASLDAGTLVPAAQLATGTPDGTKFLRDDRTWQTITAGDADAIHDNVAGEIAAITEKASPVSGDFLLIEDSAAANVKKRVQIGNLPGGGGGLTEAQVRVRVSMRV